MAIVINGSGTITGLSNDSLSGNLVDGGTVSAFASTGIDDNATSTAITVDSDEATTFASNKAGWGMDFTNSNASGYGLKISAGSGTNHALKVRDKDSNELLVVHGNGNMGLGVEPKTWHTSMTAIQLGQRASIATWNDDAELNHCANAYYAQSGGWKYIENDYATRLLQAGSGQFTFQVAPSGSADAAISWTECLKVWNNSATGPGFTVGTHNTNGSDRGYSCHIENNVIGHRNTAKLSDPQTHWRFYNTNGQVGTIVTNGSGTSYNTSSDYRLKNIHGPITDSIERVKTLKPYRFNFLADPDTTVDGFVAHEAGEVVPEAVSGEKDAMQMEEYEITPEVEEVRDDEGNITVEAVDAVMGEHEVISPQGIDQSKIVPLLTSALQTALSQIEDLTARIESLEAQ